MSFTFISFKQQESSLKSLMANKFGNLIIDLDIRIMSNDEEDRIPQMINVIRFQPIVAVIQLQTKSNYETIYDDGIARKYHEYRYYIFNDGLGSGFLPNEYEAVIQEWLKAS